MAWVPAVQEFLNAVQFDANNPEYRNNLRRIDLDAERAKLPYKQFIKANESNPERRGYWYNCAFVGVFLREYSESLVAITRAIAMWDRDVDYFMVCGSA